MNLAAAETETPAVEGALEEIRMLRDKILFSLELYHFLSKSMIHQAVGTATSRRLWDPVLDALIQEGLIECTTLEAKTPLGRNQTFTIYHLSTRPYICPFPNTYNIQDVTSSEPKA